MIKSTMSVYGIIVTSPVQAIGSILYNQVGSTLPILAVENVLLWCTQFGKTSQLLQPEIWGKLIDLDFKKMSIKLWIFSRSINFNICFRCSKSTFEYPQHMF